MPPPKRKNGAGDATTSSKKLKVESAQIKDSNLSTQWEWEGDGGKWIAFAQQHNTQITDAFNNGKNKVELQVNEGVTMVVILDKMVQKNKKSGWERRLRLALLDKFGLVDAGEYTIWEWEAKRNLWNPFPAQTAVDLAVSAGHLSEDVTLSTPKGNYTISISKLIQTNDDTGTMQIVRQIKSDAEKAPELDIPTGREGKRSGRSRVIVKAEPDDDDDEDDDDVDIDLSRIKKVSGKSKAKVNGTVKKEAENGAEISTKSVRTMKLGKGQAPVDVECVSLIDKAHVFSEGKNVWDCMLNQTNISQNNNKYFLIQLLQEDSRKIFYVWLRWGRVGYKGQTNLVNCGPDLDEAQALFMKKFSDKTRNDWSNRNKFVKVPGKYDMLKMDYEAKNDDEVDGSLKKENSQPRNVPDSKLDKRLQSLINLICDVKAMEEAVVEMKYDAKKAPLGKLTPDQIKAGYTALKKIAQCLENNDTGRNLEQACSEFYTRIPHNFGMQQPPLIRTKKEIKAKIDLLEALADIEIAIKILSMVDKSQNPIDSHYKSLACDLKPLDKTHTDFKVLEKYLKNTHANTHGHYSMEIIDVFVCEKHGEKEKFKDLGNRKLLWHGSRLSNWVGILNRGLRIAPPEAPVTGYMFGKGVYFADMSSKSANYCFASSAKTQGLLLLSEVSLGDSHELLAADYSAHKLPADKHSVWGKGAIGPDLKDDYVMADGVTVPVGMGVQTGVKNPGGYTLNYNEFIVYDESQIKMRYLLKVKFNF